MPVLSLKKIPIVSWKPPAFHPIYGLTITRTDGTVDDVTIDIQTAEFSNGATDITGDFSIVLYNSAETYSNIYTGNETVKLYLDYATSATTVRFKGIVEKVSFGNNTIKLTGRSNALPFLGLKVTKSYTDTECSEILLDLISTYSPSGYTTSNITASSTNLNVNWYEKNFWECVIELCNAAGFDCYIDVNNDFHFFEQGSVTNSTEAVLHTYNLFKTGDFGPDSSEIVNRVVVYGQVIDNIPIIAMAEDTALQTSLGRIQEIVINDTNITTDTHAQERANDELAVRKTAPTVGEVTAFGLPTLSPGDKLYISDPDNKIPFAAYRVQKFKHSIDDGFLTTVPTIERETLSIPRLFKARIQSEQQQGINPNPNAMRFSRTFYFDDDTDTGQHTNTLVSQGKLVCLEASGGSYISTTTTVSSNITSLQFIASGESLNGVTFYVSTNGSNYDQVTSGQVLIPSSLGDTITIQVIFSSNTPQIDTITVLYKFT